MSYISVPPNVLEAVAADCDLTRTPLCASTGDWVAPQGANEPDYVPISQRTSYELRANASELRKMASSATTQKVAKSLLALAERYSALADTRRRQEAGGAPVGVSPPCDTLKQARSVPRR